MFASSKLIRDGSNVEGSIVIDYDGCHSKMRAAMRRLLEETGGDVNEFSTIPEYYGIFGKADNPKGICPGTCSESRHKGRVCQLFGSENTAYYAAMKPSQTIQGLKKGKLRRSAIDLRSILSS